MKRKNLLWIAGGIFLAIAVVVMLVFVFSGDNTPQNPDKEMIKLDGTWKVAAYIQGSTYTLPEKEYFSFANDRACAYRGDTTTPFAESAYTLTASTYPNLELNLSDIGRKYTVSVITDNYIRFYESSTVYTDLIRYANADLSDLTFTQDVVLGTWDVAYRNTAEVITQEKIQFADGILTDYRNGASEPAASVPYYWNEKGELCVDALKVQMLCYPLSEDVLFFIEVSTGCVWELHAAK